MNFETQKQVTEIIESVGGKNNINYFTNCQTRLRITVKDKKKVNLKAIKSIYGSFGCFVVDKTFQVVFGPVKIKNVVAEMEKKTKTLKKIMY